MPATITVGENWTSGWETQEQRQIADRCSHVKPEKKPAWDELGNDSKFAPVRGSWINELP